MLPNSPHWIGVLALAGAVSALSLPSWLQTQKQLGPANQKPLVDSESLQALIKGDSLVTRAVELAKIASLSEDEYNHPTRVIGSKGHIGTLEYIYGALASMGDYYSIANQSFTAVRGKVFESRLVLDDVVALTYTTMSLTPATKDREPVRGFLALALNDGCSASDYPFISTFDNIILIPRGGCTFSTKSALAGKAGAAAAIVYGLDPDENRVYGTLGTPLKDHVATFGLSGMEARPLVARLRLGQTIEASAYIDAEVRTIATDNVIAQTLAGDPENCVMLGGHSDSVSAGPGINDDGSGTLSLLEVATQLSQFSVRNCVRFAWFSGEEEGLLGSDHYAARLSKTENRRIRVMMDYDMLASPNFSLQVYNATDDDNPAGSEFLRNLYTDWYDAHGLNWTLVPFDGRSDYDGFIRAGIPAGGIATGAEGVKSFEEQEMFGGEEGVAYDPCYHSLCDDIENPNVDIWTLNTKLVAHSVATFAASFNGFPERTNEAKITTYQRTVKYHGPKAVS